MATNKPVMGAKPKSPKRKRMPTRGYAPPRKSSASGSARKGKR